ncbi:hypothetical protein EW026_g2297 [Hermanssonia centrifuga]|uniref:Uncharacterized protein n=1 Tax=Hermanssonia centrifuga TaxID=98765 RepID=A0A4V3XB14_9APHY|nr:hypothetical protein EW026_g2297 [Hermanssonia centrifuga]
MEQSSHHTTTYTTPCTSAKADAWSVQIIWPNPTSPSLHQTCVWIAAFFAVIIYSGENEHPRSEGETGSSRCNTTSGTMGCSLE